MNSNFWFVNCSKSIRFFSHQKHYLFGFIRSFQNKNRSSHVFENFTNFRELYIFHSIIYLIIYLISKHLFNTYTGAVYKIINIFHYYNKIMIRKAYMLNIYKFLLCRNNVHSSNLHECPELIDVSDI